MSSFSPSAIQQAVVDFTPKRPVRFHDLMPAKDVIAEYTGKAPRRWWRPWVAVVGVLALLAAWWWFAAYAPGLFARMVSSWVSSPQR